MHCLFESVAKSLCRPLELTFVSQSKSHLTSGAKGDDCVFAEREGLWNIPSFSFQNDLRSVPWETIKFSPVKAGKSFEFIKGSGAVEHFGVKFNRGVSGVDAGATTCRFFGSSRMRSAIGAEKEPRISARRCFHHRRTMFFSFQYWQAVMVWSQSTFKQRDSIEQTVMSRDGGRHPRRCSPNKLHPLKSRQVF